MELFVDNQTDDQRIPVNEKISDWVELTIVCHSNSAIKFDEVALKVVSEVESGQLNQTYRNKSGATNVLSFPYEPIPGVDIRTLGDLAVCADVVEREAQEQGKTFESHFAHMIVHGVLHLLGYDHQEEQEAQQMEQKEITILAKCGIENPYQINEEEVR